MKIETKPKGFFTIKIPDQRHYAKGETAWDVKGQYHPRQAVVPSDPQLIKKIGLSKGDKISFFAGCTGDWAAALAKETEVHYSDASKSFMKNARKENH